jgi:dTMP kinase
VAAQGAGRRLTVEEASADPGGLVDDAARSSYRRLLRNRNYALFFWSSMGASLGDWTGLFALQILVTTLAQGSQVALFGLGGIMMARLVPSLLIGPLAGVLADRYDRKRLMVFTNLARGVLFVGISFSRDILALLALTFIVECLSLAFGAAKDASLPRVVDRSLLPEANQLNLLVTYGPLPFGALLPAAVAGLGGIRTALLLNAATLLLSGGLLSRLRLPGRGTRAELAASRGLWSELREGVAFIAELPLIRSLVMGVAGLFFGAGVVVNLGPVFVSDVLNRPETDWSLLASAVGAGVFAGIFAVRPLIRRVAQAKVFPWALALTGACASLIAVVSSFPVTLALGAAMGLAVGGAFVIGYTLLQEATPDEVRARTFAAFFTVNRFALFSSLALAPILAGAIGTVLFIAGGFRVELPGIRASILLGGLIGLASAVSSGRGMYRAVRGQARRPRTLIPPPPAPSDGLFISFEGVEGAGKSTQVAALAEALRAEGHDVLVTREPGGPPVAERIRELLLDPGLAGMDPRTEALLYAAARTEHTDRVILPALRAGRIVLSDRYLDSSLAYQGYGRGLGADDVAEVNRWSIKEALPHVVVLLALDPEEGLRRAAARRQGAPDRIEAEELAFHRRVAEGYADLVRRHPDRFLVVDAAGEPSQISRDIRLGLRRWLPLVPARRPAATGGP